ncbi:DUF1993 domain-containing protein [Pseudomonadales bacterium]|nr:DUF1993 domain-containing protein [bacterium]MDB4631560.1 DUF1993 domain-containing protein [Pseudomonadales bacterium]
MSLSMHQCSIPVFIHSLNNLTALLKKGEAHFAKEGVDASELINARLHPDMHPLSRQVQIACDVAKGAGARISGIEAPKYDDTESTFTELYTRIDNTLNFLSALPAEAINGTESKDITMQAGPYELEFTGSSYLIKWALPNLYFHISTAYNILRHNGVNIGKIDFLGPIN